LIQVCFIHMHYNNTNDQLLERQCTNSEGTVVVNVDARSMSTNSTNKVVRVLPLTAMQ